MRKYYCDRCGEEIHEAPLRMIPEFTRDLSMYMKEKISLLMQPLEGMDFCEECLAEIVDFALNKNTCDECVQQMMDENAMLRETDEEVESSSQKVPDPKEIDWSEALKRMEQGRPSIHYIVPAEGIVKAIREERQCQSEQHQ